MEAARGFVLSGDMREARDKYFCWRHFRKFLMIYSSWLGVPRLDTILEREGKWSLYSLHVYIYVF